MLRLVPLPIPSPASSTSTACQAATSRSSELWLRSGYCGITEEVICLVPLEEIEFKSPDYARTLKNNGTPWRQVMLPIVNYEQYQRSARRIAG